MMRPLTPQARLTQAARTRSQAKASASQEPPRREPEPGRRKEDVEVEDDDDEEEEDERLRQEEDQRAEQRVRKREAREAAEPVLHGWKNAPKLRDGLKGRLSWRLVPNVHLGTILPKEVEWAESGTKMDWTCVACGTLDFVVKGSKCTAMVNTGAEMNIIREADSIRFGLDIDRCDCGILHGASCRAMFCGTASNVFIEVGKVKARACFFVMPDVDHGILLGRGRLKQGSQRRYKTVDQKCRPVPVLVTEDEEVYYERERGLIRRMKEKATAGPCCINEENDEKLIIGKPDFLLPQERALMVELMKKRHRAYAFSDEERDRVDVDKIPMIHIHTVPHEPWNLRGARYPNPDEEKLVVDYLDGKISTHVADYSSGPYASPWFCFIKPNGTLRWMQDLQRLNVVTVRDAGGLPNADALSESCAGRPIISLLDLYSGYDQFPVYPPDRSVTAMQTPRGLIHMNVALQGWTNTVAMVQRAMIRVMQSVSPHITQPYIDDLAVKGPAVKESDEVLPGAIERLSGAGRFEEPIARIRREATTRQEVEMRMQELRPSPVGPDGRPIRLEIGNAADFIPAFEWFMQRQGTPRDDWARTLPLWTRKAERPLARQIKDMARDWESCRVHLREAFRRPESPQPRVERRQTSRRQRDPEPSEARPSRGGRKALARREEEPEPEDEERGAYPEYGLGPVEFHHFTEGGLRRSPVRTQEEAPASEGPLRELEAHLDVSRWGASPRGEEREEVPREEVPREEVPREEVPREEVPREEMPREEARDTQRERGLGDEGRRAGKEVIEVEKDTPPQMPVVGLRPADTPGSTCQAAEGLQREEAPLPSSEKAPSPEKRAERRREAASMRREALALIDRHQAAHALEHPDLEEPAPAEPRQEPCQPEKEVEAEIPKRVDLRTRERPPAGETAKEKRARRSRRIEEIWQERQRLEAAAALPEQQQERQSLEAAGALPGEPPSAPAKAPEIPEMWRDFWEQRGEELPSPTRAGFGVARKAEERLDHKIKFLAKTTFEGYLLLESDLAGKKTKAEGHGLRLETMEVEIQELRALVASQAAIIEDLRQQRQGGADKAESSRQGEQRHPRQGLPGQPSAAEPRQEPPMGRVILEPEEARAQREAASFLFTSS
ncbi:hypothetical protein CBR_g37343 [Chara braunii]|uniref:Reverse transcriptase domain-containing protein n=1 Tax=Chara braunii TaxID=69332 RepID=A0A388JZQ3_CHABU|nr:hypothetical protein CBR_g37343 [Chara braunii]|eukprot:GBG63257.1 hypothetical protein CBR_g37343 [Chara braunii]